MMHDNDPQVQSFLSVHGWANCLIEILAADASVRHYYRLRKGDKSAVLMDARRSGQKEIKRFCDIAELLRKQGLQAPEIYARNLKNGFLLLEDFGDDLFARVMKRDPSQTRLLYKTSLDMLIHLRKLPLPDWLSQPDSKKLSDMISPFWEHVVYEKRLKKNMRNSVNRELQRILTVLQKEQKVICLRDCHSENLMKTSGKGRLQTVGLLDFQDAFICHPAYDLVSLLQDARRDVSPELEQEMLNYYLFRSQDDPFPFLRAYRILGVQRNLRILGIFSLLAKREGKMRYLDLQPRVCEYLKRNLCHPVFDKLRSYLGPLINDLQTKFG